MIGFIGLWYRRGCILQFTITHTSVLVRSSLAVARQRLLTEDVPLQLGSRIIPALSYQLLWTYWSKIKVKIKGTLRLAVYRQSVRPGVKPLETHDQRFYFIFLQLNPCIHSPHVTSSLTRRWVCLLWICFSFVKCTYHKYSMLLKILPCAI
jgi:hypothetical protein